MKLINFTLPDYCFLDGFSPDGNTLEDRTLIFDIKNSIIIEVLPLNDIFESNFERHILKKEFEYTNLAGIKEQHLLFAYLESADSFLNNQSILDKCWKWYCAYLDWEDKNIIDDHKSSKN